MNKVLRVVKLANKGRMPREAFYMRHRQRSDAWWTKRTARPESMEPELPYEALYMFCVLKWSKAEIGRFYGCSRQYATEVRKRQLEDLLWKLGLNSDGSGILSDEPVSPLVFHRSKWHGEPVLPPLTSAG